MSVNEAIFLPDIKPDTDAWNIQAVGLSDCRFVPVFVELHDIEDLIGAVEETYTIYGH